MLLFRVFSQRVSSPIFLLALVSGFFALCRQNSLVNVSSFKCIILCVSDFLHCLDHPDSIFLSGDVVSILLLYHCHLFSDFPFLVMASCYEKVSELQCNYCSSFGKPKNEGFYRLENQIIFLVFIVPNLFPELFLSSSSTRTLFLENL